MLAMARRVEAAELGQARHQSGGEHRADAGHAFEACGAIGEVGLVLEMRRDLDLEARELAAQHAQDRVNLLAQEPIAGLAEALLLGLPHGDERVAPGDELGQAGRGRIGWRGRARRQRPAELREDGGIGLVGLGEPAARPRELAGLARIDPRIGRAGGGQRPRRAAARSRQRLRRRPAHRPHRRRTAEAPEGWCRRARPPPVESLWQSIQSLRDVDADHVLWQGSWSLSLICGGSAAHDSRPWQLFRLGRQRRASPKLRNGLHGQGRGGVSPARHYATALRDKGGV